jgi:hypothetical protein
MKFKKIMSVFASAAMLCSTVAFASAAMYPSPFTDGAAIVYGTAGATSDMASAINVYDQLKDRATGTTDASVSGEAKAVETASQPLYIGDFMNATKQSFLKAQLPTILASGKVTDDDGTELDYDLKLDVLKSQVIFGEGPDNLVAPILYADMNDNTHGYTLRIVFPTAVNVSKLTDEAITLFGKDYVFSGSASDLSSTLATRKAVLFEKSVPVTVNDGESVTAEGHTISVAVEDTNTAAITIDGTTESKDEGWSGKIGDVDIYVKNVVGPNVAGTSRYVEIYLNSNKLTLDNALEVKIGSTDLDGSNVTFTTSSEKTTEIKIDVFPYEWDDEIKYLKEGDSFTDPVFGGIKFELVSINPELEGSTRDEIVIKPSGEKKASLKFTNKAGKEYDMDILRESELGMNATYQQYNGTNCIPHSASCSYNATELGVGADYDIIIMPTGSGNNTHAGEVNVEENDYFITCNNEYTQIWRLKDIDVGTDLELKVQDQGGSSSTVAVSLSSATPGTGEGTLTLGDGSTATLSLNTTTSITTDKACGYLYTNNGAKIRLDTASWNGTNIGTDVDKTLSQIIIEEETAYNGGAFTDVDAQTLGAQQNITIQLRWNSGRSGRDMEIVSTEPSGTENTDWWQDDVGDYDYHYLTKYGSFMKRTGNTDNNFEMWYPEDAATVGFYIGEVGAAITPGTTGTAGGQITIVKDSEVSSVSSKHLIVVGGSCVNTVAAKMLDSTVPLCGADFTTKTQVGAGGYIIKVAASPENADKIAMLVAGYEAADTTNAITRAMVIDGVTTTVGTEEIYPVLA